MIVNRWHRVARRINKALVSHEVGANRKANRNSLNNGVVRMLLSVSELIEFEKTTYQAQNKVTNAHGVERLELKFNSND